MRKNFFKKSLFAILSAGAVVAPVVSLTSCSLFNKSGGQKSNYEFMNYQAYMYTDIVDKIKNTYSYTEFGELKEIEPAINENRIAAAIGSDYTNATLAGKGLIGKIDFGKLYGITSDQTQWAKILGGDGSKPGLYTPATWKLLTSFKVNKLKASTGEMLDENGKVVTDENQASHDIDGDGAEDYLWEYMAPYFIQNKVIGINLKRLAQANPSLKENDGYISQADFDAQFKTKMGSKPYTYKNILDTLKTLYHATSLTINDQYRDNMMLGSEDPVTGKGFTGNFDDSSYRKQVDGFANLVSGWTSTYDTSGVGNLERLINDDQGTAEVGLLYNGDALYAYNGGDEGADSTSLNDIRIINPINPTFLLDGLVVPKYVSDDYFESNRLYNVLSQYLYRGATFTYNDAQSSDNETSFISNNALYSNFNNVGYSPAFNQLDKYCEAEYFKAKDGSIDQNGLAIYSSTNDGINSLDKDHITIPVTNKLLNDSFNYYGSKK